MFFAVLYCIINYCNCNYCKCEFSPYIIRMTKDAKTTRQTSIGRMLKLLTKRLDTEMNTRLQPLGLSLPEFAILMMLLEREGQTQSGLGKKTAIPAHGTTRSIDALAALDLVERRTDPTSRRSHRIFLTAKGHRIGPQLFAIVAEVNDWLLDGLDEAEKQTFAATLAKIHRRPLHKNKKGPK